MSSKGSVDFTGRGRQRFGSANERIMKPTPREEAGQREHATGNPAKSDPLAAKPMRTRPARRCRGLVEPRSTKAEWNDGKTDPVNDVPEPPLLTPTRADVAEVARRTAASIEKILRATGRTLELQEDGGPPPKLTLDEPGLAACYAAATRGISVSGERAGLPALRLVFPPEPPPRGAHRPSRR